MDKSIINLTTTLAVALGLSLALLTAPVSADSTGNKQGPQASVGVATRCMLDGDGSLTVNVIVEDKGSVAAFVTDINIDPVYKTAEHKGKHTSSYDLDDGCPADTLVGGGYTCTRTFDLCDDIPLELRAINADVIVTYGTNADGGKTVSNRCTDDPDTFPDYEGGININSEELTAACTPDPD